MVVVSAQKRAPLLGALYCLVALALALSAHAIDNGVYDGGANEHVAVMHLPYDYASAQASLNRSATCRNDAHINGGSAISFYATACTATLIQSEQFTADPFYHNRLIITSAHCTIPFTESTANGQVIAGKTVYNKVIFDTFNARQIRYYQPGNTSALRHYTPTTTCLNALLINDYEVQPESSDPRVYYATKLLFDTYNGMHWTDYFALIGNKNVANYALDDYAVWLLDRPVQFGDAYDPFGEASPQPIKGARVATPDVAITVGRTLDMIGFGIEGYGTHKNANDIWVGVDPFAPGALRATDNYRKNATLRVRVRDIFFFTFDQGASDSSKPCQGDSGAAYVASGEEVDIIYGLYAWLANGEKNGAACNSVGGVTRVDIPEFYCNIAKGLEDDMLLHGSPYPVNAITKAYCAMGTASTASTVSVARIPTNGKPRPSAVRPATVDVAHHPDTHGAHVLLWILVAVVVLVVIAVLVVLVVNKRPVRRY